MKNIPFKSYSPNQILLLPPNLDELIPENHPVRVVSRVVDEIDLSPLYQSYSTEGASSFHPQMMLKVLIFAYLENIYSSRKIESALNENINFMWLSGMNKPDHNTIARFRSKRLKDHLKTIFSNIVQLLAKEGFVDLTKAYLDGTKIEANANRYTFVWKKSLDYQERKLTEKIEEFWEQVETEINEELPNKPDFPNLSAKEIGETAEKIDKVLKEKSSDKKLKQKANYAKKNWQKNKEKYEAQREVLEDRNSFSKTDSDATFMRLKDDHMQNGQLKPAYNLQLSTNDQMILNYTIEQKTTDTSTLERHVESLKDVTGHYPDDLIADAGYGSEENYDYLENKGIEPYVKYNMFHKEQKKKSKENAFLVQNLYYNEVDDFFVCPIGQVIAFVGVQKKASTNGYPQEYSKYEAKNCQDCPMRPSCHKSEYNRIIAVNHNLKRHKEKVRALLKSDKGIKHRGQRCADVEATFGILKQNKGFTRFLLRGLEKVEIETGILAISHNLKKICSKAA
jgi:transposase